MKGLTRKVNGFLSLKNNFHNYLQIASRCTNKIILKDGREFPIRIDPKSVLLYHIANLGILIQNKWNYSMEGKNIVMSNENVSFECRDNPWQDFTSLKEISLINPTEAILEIN